MYHFCFVEWGRFKIHTIIVKYNNKKYLDKFIYYEYEFKRYLLMILFGVKLCIKV